MKQTTKILATFFLLIICALNVNAINIANCNDLNNTRNNLNGNYVLTGNIDCADTFNWNSGQGFIPIHAFNGTINGSNFEIRNLYINTTQNASNVIGAGIFSSSSGFIFDLGVTNATIDGTNRTNVGIIVGFLTSTSSSTGVLYNVYTTGNVNGREAVGGIVGDLDFPSVLNHSYSTANVNAYGIDGAVGGLVGVRGGYIEQSYSTGRVNGQTSVGGLVGSDDGNGGIRFSYSTSNVTSDDSEVGGLVGRNPASGSVFESNYWDINTSGQNADGGSGVPAGLGKTTTQMKQRSTYVGWDFITTWDNSENATYPNFGTCTTNYYCSHFLTCNINNIMVCDTVGDLNSCSIPYSGSAGDFNQSCSYTAPTTPLRTSGEVGGELARGLFLFFLGLSATVGIIVLCGIFFFWMKKKKKK